MNSLRLITLRVFVALSLLATSCSSSSFKTFGGLITIRNAIIEEFGENDVNVTLNNDNILAITFINSSLMKQTREERFKRAQQTIAVVKRHYSQINTIREIWVGFVRSETRYVVVTFTEQLDSFGFDRNGAVLTNPGPGADQKGDDLIPTASYSANQNLTEVSVTPIQLIGDLSDGIALLAHYKVTGDATRQKAQTEPSFVALDFASYSKQRRFPEAVTISIKVDNRVAFSSKGTFVGSKTSDGPVAEFLWLKLSYPQFCRLTDGETVIVVLGNDEYPLTAGQLSALRSMRDYVKE